MARRRKVTSDTHLPPSSDEDSQGTEEVSGIPEDEQWRLINETGILTRAPPEGIADESMTEDLSLADEIFNSVTLIIPFSSLLLLMEILIHQQYGQRINWRALADRLIPGVLIMSPFIFYSIRHKHTRQVQAILFFLAIAVGTRMIYLVNRGSWLVNMKQCPPLATAWAYAILQLELGSAVISLGIVGAWVWWMGLKLIF